MKRDATLPLTRMVAVEPLPREGADVTVEATPQECAAIARDFKLPAVHSLVGTYHLSAATKRVNVKGQVKGRVTQTCVVTLDPFEADVVEDVDVDFAEPGAVPPAGGEDEHDADPPDEITDGQIDLGALTAEFLALGLDPYPRKPGAEFTYVGGTDKPESPFAVLGRRDRGT